MAGARVIAACGLAVGYGRCLVAAEIDLALRAGELLAIVGPNGAGKSTLLRTLAGLLPPLRGVVRFGTDDLHALAPAARARRVAYVTADDAAVAELDVDEIVAQGRASHRPWWRWGPTQADEHAVARAIRLAGLAPLLRRRIGSLSSGEAQRAWIGMALAQDAPVLLLDEPTSHLDVRRAHETLELLLALAAEGHALGVVVHDLNLAARYAHRVAVVAGGGLCADGPPREVIRPDVLSAAYDADVRVLYDDDGTPVAIPRPPKDARRSERARVG